MAVMVADHPPTSLALSEIIHTMSPSPAPQSNDSLDHQDTPGGHSTQRSDSPEPLQDEEVANFRRRVVEMSTQSTELIGMSSREQELASMVMRLTEPTRPSSAQVMCQANLISQLTSQRDYLIQQTEEERARWQSEKDGWARVSEALIAQRNKKDHYSTKQEDLERYCNSLQADNTELRHKEQETSARLNTLENEIFKLKPMLLLQPFPSMPTLSAMTHASSYLSSLPYPAPTGLAAVSAQRAKLSRRKKREKEKGIPVALADAAEGEDVSDSENPASASTPATASNARGNNGSGTVINPAPMHQAKPPWAEGVISTATTIHSRTQESIPSPSAAPIVPRDSPGNASAPAIYQHLLRPPISLQPSPTSLPHTIGNTTRNAASKGSRSGGNNKTGAKTSVPTLPLTSDARSEHILLAARKIGRERAAIAAGLVEAGREKERDREQQERAKMQKERLAAGITGYYRPSAGGNATATSNDTKSKDTNSRNTNPANQSTASSSNDAVPSTLVAAVTSPKTPKRTAPATRMVGASTDMISPATTESLGSARFTGYHRPPETLPPTPMDSLLSAARSMMDRTDTGAQRNAGGSSELGARRRSNVLEQPTTPTQKRRKVTSTAAVASGSSSEIVNARVRSALDVLADQAAAAFSSEKPNPRAKSKGKGKERSLEDASSAVDHEKERATEEEILSTTTKSGRKTRATKAAVAAAKDKRASASRKSKAESSRTGSSTPRMISPADPKVSAATSNSRRSTPRLISAPDSSSIDRGGSATSALSTGRNEPTSTEPSELNLHEPTLVEPSSGDVGRSTSAPGVSEDRREGIVDTTMITAPTDGVEKDSPATAGSHPPVDSELPG